MEQSPQYGKPYDEATDDYHREPFVADVSEGKSDPIYMAHTYHTKVPYKAIMPFIKHYTQPGELVFDGFCGTGMTGIAAQATQRKAILCDLAPIATFIANNINNPPADLHKFKKEALSILNDVKKECSWLYETTHSNGKKAQIVYTLWSDVFTCPYCNYETTFWDIAILDKQMLKELSCPGCKAELKKGDLEHVYETVFDASLGKNNRRMKQSPVLIVYSFSNKRYEKRPDRFDLELISKIESLNVPYLHPVNVVPEGDKTGEPLRAGISHVHMFYSKRNLWTISALWNKINQIDVPEKLFFLFTVTSFLVKTGSKLHNVGFKKGSINLAGQVPNTLYIPSILAERSIFELYEGKVDDMVRAFESNRYSDRKSVHITTQSTTDLRQIPSQSIDYIFVDPPFGSNLIPNVQYLWS